MQSTDTNPNSLNSCNFSSVTQEELKVIQQAEAQLNQNKKEKVILIAYNTSAKQ